WAEKNLQEVERNKREKHTVPWRYVILRLHEAVIKRLMTNSRQCRIEHNVNKASLTTHK
ncbi:hypothetical protein ACVWB4_23525, partial [Escherichia coli]